LTHVTPSTRKNWILRLKLDQQTRGAFTRRASHFDGKETAEHTLRSFFMSVLLI
jgi:hypothetical protein